MSPLKKLKAILDEHKIVASIKAENISPSSYYDSTYSMGLIAIIFHTVGSPVSGQPHLLSINPTILRFFHFCAIRPYLLDEIRKWKASKKIAVSLFETIDINFLPHSFLLDRTTLELIQFLIASNNLTQASPVVLILNTQNSEIILNKIYNFIQAQDLMLVERNTTVSLKELRVTLTDLGVN